MREFKDSKAGQIPVDWEVVQISELCDKVTDGTHDSPKRQDTGHFLITSKHIKGRNIDFDNAYKISKLDYDKINLRSSVDQWDVIISMIGEYCGFAYLERNENINYAIKNVGLFKTGNKENAFWLFYFLQSKFGRFYLESNRSGSSQPYITLKTLRALPVLTPSNVKEKQQIISILSALDDKIDLLHRQNKTLEGMAEVLFREWFVERDFTSKVKDLINLQNGYAFKSKDFTNEGENRVLKIKNISANTVDINTSDFISTSVVNNVDGKFKINSGDVLFAMTGAKIGKTGIVPRTSQKLWLNQRVGLFKEKYLGSRYLAYLQLKSDYGLDYIENTATGSAQPNISGNGIEDCGFPKISELEIKKYSKILLPLFEKIVFNLGQIENIENLRDTLLPKLMSGAVRVKM